ncbi:MAG: hypothetical protein WA584_16365 [Pyrinomonadaceae bacterium]
MNFSLSFFGSPQQKSFGFAPQLAAKASALALIPLEIFFNFPSEHFYWRFIATEQLFPSPYLVPLLVKLKFSTKIKQ